ncbi:MAG: amidohydrolase family protein [Actinomycetota bacterium]
MLRIEGARLYDGNGGEPLDDAVLIAGPDGRITYAGPAKGAPKSGGERIDAAGRALIPGLIDCHVHLCFDGVADFEGEAAEMAGNPARAALKAAANAKRALHAGITTVRDLGGIGTATIEAARAQAEGIIEGPRIITTGEALTITGGHGHFISREVDSAEDMVRAVRALKKAGATCIKIIATGGVLTRGIGAQRSAFTAAEIAAAVNEAHEAGMRVAAHAIGAAGIVAALQGGVDSIEHGCFLTDEAVKLMPDNPSWLVATLVAPHQIIHGGEGVPEFAIEKSEEVGASHRASFRKAAEAGVNIASGTDAGTPFNPHGGLWLELQLMNENGMPLDVLLSAATREGARLIGVDDVGTLEAGKRADAILLDADPLGDVAAYRHVSLVVQSGRVVADRRSA